MPALDTVTAFRFPGVCLPFPLHTLLSQETSSFLSIPLFPPCLHVWPNSSFLWFLTPPRVGSAIGCSLCIGQAVPSLSSGTFPSGTSPSAVLPETPGSVCSSASAFEGETATLLPRSRKAWFGVFQEEAELWFWQGIVARLCQPQMEVKQCQCCLQLQKTGVAKPKAK